MDSSRVPSAMSEEEIMKNHVLYQKSYVEDLVTPRRHAPLKYYTPRIQAAKKVHHSFKATQELRRGQNNEQGAL